MEKRFLEPLFNLDIPKSGRDCPEADHVLKTPEAEQSRQRACGVLERKRRVTPAIRSPCSVAQATYFSCSGLARDDHA